MNELYPFLPIILLIVCCSKPIDEGSFVQRKGIYYKVISQPPSSGKLFRLHKNGQTYYERSFKNGKQSGLEILWFENGQKREEGTWNENG